MLKLQELHTRRGKPQRKICFDYDDSIIGCDFQSMFNYALPFVRHIQEMSRY